MNKKIIHIHIPKTGGSWLNKTLGRYASEYFLPTADFNLRVSDCVHSYWRDSTLSYPTAQVYYDKMEYQIVNEVKKTTEEHVFDDAMKISIVRNPFDLLVSFYHFQPNDDKSLSMRKYVPGGGPTGLGNCNAVHGISSFEDFVKKWCDPNFPWEWRNSECRYFLFHQMFNAAGRCGVDVIMKNEELNAATYQLMKDSGYGDFPEILTSKRNHTSSARNKADYRSFYTDELRELVQKHCQAELVLFDYDFDGINRPRRFVNPNELFYLQETRFSCRNFSGNEKLMNELVGVGHLGMKAEIASLKENQSISETPVACIGPAGELYTNHITSKRLKHAADQLPDDIEVRLGRWLVRDAAR